MSATNTYRIHEIFYSLQGEGFHTGRPAVFVRFAGCNLRCPFCDTDFSMRQTMTCEDIVRQALSLIPSSLPDGRFLLVLTGGEPALQVDDTLIDALHKAGFYIAIETNGTRTLPAAIDWITCSPKDAPVVLTQADELKVVFRGQDVERLYQGVKAQHYFLQPCDLTFETGTQQSDTPPTQSDTLTPQSPQTSTLRETIAYILSHPHWRLSLQMHKLTGIR
jgi:organic radical activating enzyme